MKESGAMLIGAIDMFKKANINYLISRVIAHDDVDVSIL